MSDPTPAEVLHAEFTAAIERLEAQGRQAGEALRAAGWLVPDGFTESVLSARDNEPEPLDQFDTDI
jgi:hypothetical protein